MPLDGGGKSQESLASKSLVFLTVSGMKRVPRLHHLFGGSFLPYPQLFLYL